MLREHIAFRATLQDNQAIEVIANALPRAAFPTLTATIQAALSATAELARQGLLDGVLMSAKASRGSR